MLDKLPTELKYVLIMAAIVLFQYVLKRFSPQPPEPSPVPPPEEETNQAEDGTDEDPATQSDLAVDPGYFGRTEGRRVAGPRVTRRYARRSLMGSKRQTQNAVVIATILGPCRAFESHDSR